MSAADWAALSLAQKRNYGLVAVQSSDTGYDRGELYYGADYHPESVQMTPDSTSGPSGTTGTWTASTGYNGYYTTENIENGYFLLSYNDPFYLTEIYMESSAINNSSWAFIFEYYDVAQSAWVEAYNSTSQISPTTFTVTVQNSPFVNAVRWRTTTKKVYPYNIRIPTFYAKGYI